MAVITGLSPSDAKKWGGTEITVTGSGLAGASELYFRDMNGKRYDVVDYAVHSDSRITLITPATGQIGRFDLYVIVGGRAATTPLENTTVWDGDRLGATGTAGGSVVQVQNNANRIWVADR
ncbi:IPT/TIG domain-containing protein [Nocardia exalbida]|uniref:IPT/TIG domain-containing protein n=1 Tax=Nocardia exalbida TaxID=290231 RepID=UPI000593C313|nr:IPT/TIG domain-containing protein [Nocardia exalbida]